MDELPPPGADLARWAIDGWQASNPDFAADPASFAIRFDLTVVAYLRMQRRALKPWRGHGILNMDDYRAVAFLRHIGEPGVRIQYLAEYLNVDAGSLGSRLSRLVDAGLLERFDDPYDGRANRVRILPHTEPLIDEIHAVLMEGHQIFFANLDADEQRVFAALIGKL